MPRRQVPLIVIGSTSSTSFADSVASQLRSDGNVVYVTHSAGGCLRVVTSVGPDLVLLDPALPLRLEHLIKAHPTSAGAQILHLSDSVPRPTFRLGRATRAQGASSAAGPHAA
jgi:CheY-like chemotaxis protein